MTSFWKLCFNFRTYLTYYNLLQRIKECNWKRAQTKWFIFSAPLCNQFNYSLTFVLKCTNLSVKKEAYKILGNIQLICFIQNIFNLINYSYFFIDECQKCMLKQPKRKIFCARSRPLYSTSPGTHKH